jgi:uncharacterized protein YejL (UPF0352 family)
MGMEQISVAEFGDLAHSLAATARSAGLIPPSFRSPPHLSGRSRTVRRYGGGNCLVSVQTKGRDRSAVIEDMIEGVVVANKLTDGVATAARRTLAKAFAQPTPQAA